MFVLLLIFFNLLFFRLGSTINLFKNPLSFEMTSLCHENFILMIVIAEIGFRGLNATAETEIFCRSSPLILTFYSNYGYAMFTYVLVFTMISL
jgi:hypothetical protein